MDNFIYNYQHLSFHINPTAFSLGFLKVDWYSLMYLFGFLTIYGLLLFRLKKKESSESLKKFDKNKLFDLLLVIFVGLIVGARLGYVIFYNLSYYISEPWAIISPFSSQGKFIGIYGMSYHGGLLGAILAFWFFVKKSKLNFWELADFIVPAVPAGYFFGRLGNFLNGELYGRVTEQNWGMFFPGDSAGALRHPSQLYEAFLEGIILFIILWSWRNKKQFSGKLLGIYILSYGIFRILVEFFRQPDEQIGLLFNLLTLGQLLSLFMIIAGVILIFLKKKKMV